MSQKNARRCTQCRLPGHTKRTCLGMKQTAEGERQKKTTKRSAAVVVRIDKNDHSPHVVRLRAPEKNSTTVGVMPVHKDTYAPAPLRVAVNLADLVRSANSKRTIRVIGETSAKPSSLAIDLKPPVTTSKKEKKGKGFFSHGMIEKKSSKKSHELTSVTVSEKKKRVKEPTTLAKYFRSLFFWRQPALPEIAMSTSMFSTKEKTTKQSKKIVASVLDHVNVVRSSLLSQCKGGAKRFYMSLYQSFSLPRLAYAVLSLLLVIGLPFPAVSYYEQISADSARVVDESTNAFLSLQSSTIAALQSNLGQAKSDLNNALQSFAAAEGIVERDHKLLAYVAGMLPVVGKQVSSRQHLLRAGQHLALGNTYLVKGIDTVSTDATAQFTDRLTILGTHLRSAVVQYEAALIDLAAIDVRALPSEYQASFEEFKLLYAVFIDDMKDLKDLTDTIATMFGSHEFKRYLVLFQNHHELRPTGGFMGSFAVVDVQKGKILNIDVPAGGTYDIKGQVDVYLKPPLPLQLSNKRWEFQDANWFPDFAASAEKSAWFYERGRKTTVDGVIAVNATVLERLLRVMGPVENEKYHLVLDAETALTSIQEEVEFGEEKKQNRPKAIISELLSQLLTGITEVDNASLVRMLGELHEAMEEKEIQVYMRDQSTQEKLRSFGWTGELVGSRPGQDYLMVVNTNVQGAKTDAKIQQAIHHEAQVREDGRVTVTVRVERQHQGEPGDPLYGVNNVSYMRLYVPEGAELIEVEGFSFPPEDLFKVPEKWYVDDPDLVALEANERIDRKSGTRITTEFGKTVFGTWTIIPPGEKRVVVFTYVLPFRVARVAADPTPDTSFQKWKTVFFEAGQTEASRYSLITQKQSGAHSRFTSIVTYPEHWRPVWKTDDTVTLLLNGFQVDRVDVDDEVVGVVMEKIAK